MPLIVKPTTPALRYRILHRAMTKRWKTTAPKPTVTPCAARVSGTGEGVLIKCDPNTSLYFANVRLPAVKYAIAKGHTVMDTDITDIAEK